MRDVVCCLCVLSLVCDVGCCLCECALCMWLFVRVFLSVCVDCGCSLYVLLLLLLCVLLLLFDCG